MMLVDIGKYVWNDAEKMLLGNFKEAVNRARVSTCMFHTARKFVLLKRLQCRKIVKLSCMFETGSNMIRIGLDDKMQDLMRRHRSCSVALDPLPFGLHCMPPGCTHSGLYFAIEPSSPC